MKIEFDPAKSEKNELERGLPFTRAKAFEFRTAIRVDDKRKEYGERRILAYGYIGHRLHVLCYKPVAGGIRVISLRKANKREEKFYAEETQKI